MWAHPGKKLLFMGGELGEWDEWNARRVAALEPARVRGAPGRARRSSATSTASYRETPALWEVDFEPEGFRWLEANDASNNVLAFARLAPRRTRPLVCVLNLSPVPRYEYRVGMPPAAAGARC